MTAEKISRIVRDLCTSNDSLRESIDWIAIASEHELQMLCAELTSTNAVQTWRQNVEGVDLLGAALVERAQKNRDSFSKSMIEQIEMLYRSLPSTDRNRRHFLRMLSTVHGAQELQLFAELVADDPPADATAAMDAFLPLFQTRSYSAAELFPRLLDALGHVQVAAVVLDLANFLSKEKSLDRHPLADRQSQAIQLLGGIVQRLEMLEEKPIQASPRAASQVTESVALAISLCQSVVLMKTREAIGKLHQMLDLRHRRLRVEAAYALACLEQPLGRQTLAEMASEPSMRLRVLAYAEELKMLDELPRRFKNPLARAEAELATWLAEPTRFGVPPIKIELFDQRAFFWPGFDEPVDCYLFRFVYPLPSGEHSNLGIANLGIANLGIANLGIAGPLTFAFAEDVCCLDSQDVYALFAGWHAEHQEISQIAAADWTDSHRQKADDLLQQLSGSRYQDVQPRLLGSFFGEDVLVCSARTEHETGHLLVDPNGFAWLKHGDARLPLAAVHVWSIFKGRKLLRTFNKRVDEDQ